MNNQEFDEIAASCSEAVRPSAKNVMDMKDICERAGVSDIEYPSMEHIMSAVKFVLDAADKLYYPPHMDTDGCDQHLEKAIKMLEAAREFNQKFGF
jgi:hypothetical protein